MLDELHPMQSERTAQQKNAVTGKGLKREDTANAAFNVTDANALQVMSDRFRHLEYYNAVATGDWPGMSIPATVEKSDDKDKKTIRTYAESLGLNSLFTRTSLTDYQLADALLNELELRGFEINPSSIYSDKKHRSYQADNDDHIVIISEWDTIYGRLGLPRAMKEQLVPMESYCNKDDIRNNQCNWRADVNWVHSFSYMRGLDGVTPDTDKNTQDSKDDKQTNKNNSADINMERAESARLFSPSGNPY